MSAAASAPGLPPVRVEAVHVTGVRSLAPGHPHLELRFSEAGLQIFDRQEHKLVGQLGWSEITAVKLERRRLGRPRQAPRLAVATPAGRAVFSLPGLTRRQIEDHLGPVLRPTAP